MSHLRPSHAVNASNSIAHSKSFVLQFSRGDAACLHSKAEPDEQIEQYLRSIPKPWNRANVSNMQVVAVVSAQIAFLSSNINIRYYSPHTKLDRVEAQPRAASEIHLRVLGTSIPVGQWTYLIKFRTHLLIVGHKRCT
jgi:hypothetical protein